MIEDFGMDSASYEEIYKGLTLMGFAGDAVARRRLAVLAYAARPAGGRRRKTQRRRARRVKRVKQRRTLGRRRRV
jgi:hypothetical protein